MPGRSQLPSGLDLGHAPKLAGMQVKIVCILLAMCGHWGAT